MATICRTCRFFDPAPEQSSMKGNGYCRRRSPGYQFTYARPTPKGIDPIQAARVAALPPVMTTFPIVAAVDWCGEHEAGQRPQVPAAETADAGTRQ